MLQRCLDFEPHQVIWIVDPTAPMLIGEARPLTPDQGNQHCARANRLSYYLGKVQAGIDGVQVHKDPRGGETLAQLELQQARVGRSVRTPVAQEDPMR